MTYLKELHKVLIYGGRNDLEGSHNYRCLNDTMLLNLETMAWEKVEAKGNLPSARCGH